MKYTCEHHNWDLTIMASSKLMDIGKSLKKESNYYRFSAFTGAMILAVLGLESFLNSIGFYIKNDICYNEFERKSIENKLDFICSKYKINFDKSKRPYQTIKMAIRWRNSINHSKPTHVDETEIKTSNEIRVIPLMHVSSTKYEAYEKSVNEETADRFNRDIIDVIQIIIKQSGINPKTHCTYKGS